MGTQPARIAATYNRILRGMTDNFHTSRRLIETLRAATHPRLRYPLTITAYARDSKLSESLPVDPAAYHQASFRVGSDPPEEGGRVFYEGVFGYNLSDEFRRVGPLKYMWLDDDGNVLEVGFDSAELLREFHYHLHGRPVPKQLKKRMVVVQEAVFAHLRAHPQLKASLEDFVASRGWPEGIAEKACLAYFDARTANLKEWAAERGFTDEEMWLAGWYEMNFTREGEVVYSVRDSHVIRIPYFYDNHIETWRTRNLRAARAETHKYTSWPLNRSLTGWQRLEHRLYNGWRLAEAKGKTVVITEGEFKCMIATHVGVLTVGIPGITEVDDEVLRALVRAGAKRYVVVLDRDPVGKGIMRVDGITDSQRAAYFIAKRLQEVGAHDVVVGQIPDVRNGEKVGLDDLILDKGSAALFKLIQTAKPPADYARSIGLSIVFCNLRRTRQELRKALEYYEWSCKRGGKRVSKAVYEKAKELAEAVDALYRDYLSKQFLGARRLDQPLSKYVSMYRTKRGIHHPEDKLILSADGRELTLEAFSEDIVTIVFAPQDADLTKDFALGGDFSLPFTSEQLRQVRDTGAGPRRLIRMLARGAEVLGANLGATRQGKHALKELMLIAMVGWLSYWFPDDEYRVERDIRLMVRQAEYWEEVVRIPVTVFRRATGVVVFTGSSFIWEADEPADYATVAAHQTAAQTAWFLRLRVDRSSISRYHKFTATLWPYWFERGLNKTAEVVARFGISPETVLEQELLFLGADDMQELFDHLAFRRALNQATQAGLFYRNDDGFIAPRFSGDVVLLPIKDEEGVVALRVFPLETQDQGPPAMPPEGRIVRHLYGRAQHLVPWFDPTRHVYMGHNLERIAGGTLLITFHELDGLALAAGPHRVISLNSSFHVRPEVAKSIAYSQPAVICVVISESLRPSPYDGFEFDSVQGIVKEVYDLRENIRAALPEGGELPKFKILLNPRPLTQAVRVHGVAACLEAILGNAVDLDTYLHVVKFNPQQQDIVRRFIRTSARLMGYLELLALPNLLDRRPIDWWVRESKRLYLAIQTYASQTHGATLPPVEEYFRRKLRLDVALPLEELLRQRQEEGRPFIHRPLYRMGSGEAAIPPWFLQDFRETITTTVSDVPLPSNGLWFPQARRTTPRLEGNEMLTHPKSIVLQYLMRQTKTTPVPEVNFSQDNNGFQCRIAVTLGDKTFRGSGAGGKKKDAEAEAYRGILQKMAEADVDIECAENVDTEVESDGVISVEPTVVQRQREVEKALAALRMRPGDSNYIGCVHQFAQAARLRAAVYDTTPASISEGSHLQVAWNTVVTLVLHDDTVLRSEPYVDANKKASQQKAAGDLIARIWTHFE